MSMHSKNLDLIAYYSAGEEVRLADIKEGSIEEEKDLSWVYSYLAEQNISGSIKTADDYPEKMLSFPAPYLFYYQGNLKLLDQKILGIVGPRNPSDYASKVMEHFFSSLRQHQLVTISGLARGIDQATHQLSLKYQIPTVAVLWWGFQHYLRSQDRQLIAQIVEHGGLVLSEFKLGFKPTKWSFPQRNKLIAGLSDLLFLPEAQQRSGSLITLDFAHQYQKPIYSVPGPIFSPDSAGVLHKYQEKKLEFILDFPHFCQQHFPKRGEDIDDLWTTPELSKEQTTLYQLLRKGAKSFDELVLASGLERSILLQELTYLELLGLISQQHSWIYSCI